MTNLISYPSRGYSRGKYESRKNDPVAIVVHTTGGGVIRRWRRTGKTGTPFEQALEVFQRYTNAGPHFVVGQRGEIECVCPLDLVAWHVGKRKSWPYRRVWSTWRRYKRDYPWWFQRWPELASPRDLASGELWSGGSCNAQTVGIEVVPPVISPRGLVEGWSAECWATLVDLLSELSSTYTIPLNRYHIIGHSDAHPISRTARKLPWDPTPVQFNPNILESCLVTASATRQ